MDKKVVAQVDSDMGVAATPGVEEHQVTDRQLLFLDSFACAGKLR